MCEHIDLSAGKCRISKDICPFVYFCNRIKAYKVLSSMPKNCKMKDNLLIPTGAYKVCFERRGNLYVDMDGKIEVVANPFDYTPVYVKMTKLKSGKWRIKEAIGGVSDG